MNIPDKIKALATCRATDEDRLQVLIHLTAELAERVECTANAAGPRFMRLPVTPACIIAFLKDTEGRQLQVVGNPLPEDTTVVRVVYDEVRDVINLVLHSEAFEPVPDHAEIPEYPELRIKDWTGKLVQMSADATD